MKCRNEQEIENLKCENRKSEMHPHFRSENVKFNLSKVEEKI